MVRRVDQVRKSHGVYWYELACGHDVIAQDFSAARGVNKPWQWCPCCWVVEKARPAARCEDAKPVQ
jgi:hypothetical protein